MMSQIEIWNMEEYCERRNRQMEESRKGTISRVGLFFLIAGIILTAMSACLITYVLKMSIAMTGVTFLITGVAGALAGMVLVVFSLKRI